MGDPINVGLIGLGVVGSGTYRVLTEKADLITRKVGRPVRITRVAVRNVQKPRSVAVPREMLTTDAYSITRDPAIHIVCELVGGVGDALFTCKTRSRMAKTSSRPTRK